ncbi:MAG: hypothetical protein ACXV2I_06390, partial [Actinomycetes bacterium]
MNFDSVADVASAVAHAATDPSLRGRVIEVGGPDDLTLNDVARQAQQLLGTIDKKPKHLPRTALRVLATTGRLV